MLLKPSLMRRADGVRRDKRAQTASTDRKVYGSLQLKAIVCSELAKRIIAHFFSSLFGGCPRLGRLAFVTTFGDHNTRYNVTQQVGEKKCATKKS